MSEEVIIINDEPFYRIPNGTSYDYAPIPKEFKPYFERLQQENTYLKKSLENAQDIYKNSHKYTSECEDKVIELKSVLKEIREYIKENENESIYLDCKLYETKVYNDLLEIIDKGIGE